MNARIITVRTGSRLGFTLLELLVAVALAAIVGGAVLAAFSGGLRVWERSDTYGRSEQMALFVMARMGRDIANAVAVGDDTFDGDRGQFSLLTQREVYAGPIPAPLEAVTYLPPPDGGGGVLRRAEAWPRGRGGVQEELMGEAGLRVAFAYATGMTMGEPSGWLDQWRSETNLPHAVRIVLVTEDGESLERVVHPGCAAGLISDDGEGGL
jgi:prepilin-type N-terminal cleavage/methylation domain-containing protein